MTITSLHGDNLDILPTLAPGSIQALITSPPYFGLRSYAIPPSSWPAVEYTPLIGLPPVVIPPMVCQLGAEPDPLAYIGHLVHVFRLARPALRRDGTLWVNLGDSYAASGGHTGQGASSQRQARTNVKQQNNGTTRAPDGIPDKNLLGIPARAALALQADGWVWRNDIIWHAPNKMPESVRDRFTRAHEDVLLFGNSARYYFDSEAVAEGAVKGAAGNSFTNGATGIRQMGRASEKVRVESATRNRRDVFSIPTTPMPAHLRNADEAHYAAWPPALVEIMVKAASANKACGACGAAYVRETEYGRVLSTGGSDTGSRARNLDAISPKRKFKDAKSSYSTGKMVQREKITLGFAPACTCGAPVGRCVILDPFAGTGTTGAVAESLGRDSILIDLGYQTLQAKRTDGLQITLDALL